VVKTGRAALTALAGAALTPGYLRLALRRPAAGPPLRAFFFFKVHELGVFQFVHFDVTSMVTRPESRGIQTCVRADSCGRSAQPKKGGKRVVAMGDDQVAEPVAEGAAAAPGPLPVIMPPAAVGWAAALLAVVFRTFRLALLRLYTLTSLRAC
jgi:hypothetical protein